MRKKLLDFMRGRFGILWCMAVLLSAMFPAKVLLAGQEQVVEEAELGISQRREVFSQWSPWQ